MTNKSKNAYKYTHKANPWEAGEMAQQLRALAALIEDPGSIPSTHRAALVPGNPMPSSDSRGHQAHMWFTDM